MRAYGWVLPRMLDYILQRQEVGADAVTTVELSIRMGIPYVAAYRLLCAAEIRGYIVRHPRRGYGTRIEVLRKPESVVN